MNEDNELIAVHPVLEGAVTVALPRVEIAADRHITFVGDAAIEGK